MRLIKLPTKDGDIYVNPLRVYSVRTVPKARPEDLVTLVVVEAQPGLHSVIATSRTAESVFWDWNEAMEMEIRIIPDLEK